MFTVNRLFKTSCGLNQIRSNLPPSSHSSSPLGGRQKITTVQKLKLVGHKDTNNSPLLSLFLLYSFFPLSLPPSVGMLEECVVEFLYRAAAALSLGAYRCGVNIKLDMK